MRKRRRTYVDGWIDEGKLAVKSGLLELLCFLDEISMPKAVATSTGYERAIHKLALTNLLDHFPIVIAGDQIEKGKPAPDIFLAAAARLDILPERLSCLGRLRCWHSGSLQRWDDACYDSGHEATLREKPRFCTQNF